MTTQAFRLAFVLVAALLGATIHPASAQTCPDRTIHLIVGYASGGTGDIVATAVSDALGRRLNATVVIDHRPGGSGGAAAQEVAKATPDGCTLLVGQTAEIAVNPAISRNLGYDPARDLQPLALLATVPLALVVPRSAPYTSVAELVQAGREARPTLAFASAGRGTPGYFAGELLRLRTRTGHGPHRIRWWRPGAGCAASWQGEPILPRPAYGDAGVPARPSDDAGRHLGAAIVRGPGHPDARRSRAGAVRH